MLKMQICQFLVFDASFLSEFFTINTTDQSDLRFGHTPAIFFGHNVLFDST